MASGIFYRNVRARDQLELFLVAAVSSFLLVRFYLHITGYPQIGGGGFHIAHMLWGGMLMLAALVMNICFLGARIQRITAILGGAGFGIFIDEIGKFITQDNDYFFRPTVGIIYAIFTILYLTFNFLSRKQKLRSVEYQLNALSQFEEAIVKDLDTREKKSIAALLDAADQNDDLTKSLRHFLREVDALPPPERNKFRKLIGWLDTHYQRFWAKRRSNTLVQLFFIAEALVFIGSVIAVIYRNLHGALTIFTGHTSFAIELAVGQLGASVAAAIFAIWGTVLLKSSRIQAYEQFRRATLVNLFLTEFFMFSRIQFDAIPGFLLNLVVLGCLTYAIHLERKK